MATKKGKKERTWWAIFTEDGELDSYELYPTQALAKDEALLYAGTEYKLKIRKVKVVPV